MLALLALKGYYPNSYILLGVEGRGMEPKLIEQLDSRFFQTMRGSLVYSHKDVSEAFDTTNDLNAEELFMGGNIQALDYLFNVAAIAISSKNSSGLVHPVIATPSVGTSAVFNFLKERLEQYSKREPAIRFVSIDCKTLVGRSKLYEEDESIEIPNLIKWRIENETTSFGTKLFLLSNASEILSSGTITLKEVISELNSISEEASFIVFLNPSAYYFVNSTFDDEDVWYKFARLSSFEEFQVSDLTIFKNIIENRLKRFDSLSSIKIDELGLEIALVASRGIPFYAFKLIQDAIKTTLFEGRNDVSESIITQVKTDLNIDKLWKNIGTLTNGQVDILAALSTFPEKKADIYGIKDRLYQFRKFAGDRSAILQQVRRLYENDLLDRERPMGCRQVYYKIKKNAFPAIEYKIKKMLREGNDA